MTYAQAQLGPLGFRTTATKTNICGHEREVTLQCGDTTHTFNCVCPAYPSIMALGCPLHHDGPGSSGSVEDIKKFIP